MVGDAALNVSKQSALTVLPRRLRESETPQRVHIADVTALEGARSEKGFGCCEEPEKYVIRSKTIRRSVKCASLESQTKRRLQKVAVHSSPRSVRRGQHKRQSLL